MTETIPNWLKKRAFLTPNRLAIRFNGEQYTFLQLYNESLRVARQIKSLAIEEGSYVALIVKNNLDSIYTLFGLQICGYKTVLLNNRLTARELNYQIKNSNAQLLIVDDSFTDRLKEIKEINEDLNSVNIRELFKRNEVDFPIKEEFNLNDVCTIMYTSGTTGLPKGVVQTYGNHWWSAVASVLNLGLRDDDCWLLAVPIFHISGFSILIRSLVYGITVDLHEQFNEERVNEAIINEGVTIVSAVSTMLSRLINNLKLSGRTYPASFRCMLLGGGPAAQTILEQCRELHIPVFQTYGMTETASQIVTLSAEDSLLKLGSAGKPLFPAQLKIVNSNNELVNSRVAGEIVVKGPNVTSKYLNSDEAVLTHDGWFHTGDIGYVDEDGYLYVLDRRSDLIISGGENVYPAEIEAVLLSHEDVLDAGVVGMKDDKWGEVAVAFVVLNNKSSTTSEQLYDYCLERLAKYKVPKKFYKKSALPRNATNKLMRNKLRELL